MRNEDNHSEVVHLSEAACNLKKRAEIRDSYHEGIRANSSVNFYFLVAVVSLLIYIVLVMSSGLKLTDIMVVQLPLVVIFSLFLTFMTQNSHSIAGYVTCFVFAVLFYLVDQSLSLAVAVVILTMLIIYYTNKIYHNPSDYRLGFPKIGGFRLKSMFKNSFVHLKYHICLSVILLVAGILIAYFYPSLFQSILQGTMQNLQQGASSITTEGLFVNNSSVALMMMLASLLLSIPTVYLLIFNGIIIGFVGVQVPLSTFLVYTIPHGIFELTAIVIAGAVAFRLTQAFLEIANGIINSKVKFSEAVHVGADMIMDCIIPLIIVIVFLVIAAFIEANLTVPIGQVLLGL